MEIVPQWVPVAFFIIASIFVGYSAAAHTDLTTDALALLALLPRIRADTFLNWSDNTTSLVCTWTGVTCNSRYRRVVALELTGMGLNWSVPPEFGNLTFLVSLNLTDNHFSSNLPQQWSGLQRLESMDLSYNYFIGEIPSWIGLLKELRVLYLDHNRFYGVLPPSLGYLSKLENLTLQYNDLIGVIPSKSIAKLSNLVHLDLSWNKFTGISFSDMCSGNSNIRYLHLIYNLLEGESISNIPLCSQLRWISIGLSGLFGELPKTLDKLKWLEELYLNSTSITGTIPTEIANMTNLRVLDLSNNQITGIIPKELGRLNHLEDIDLGGNSFWGELPMEIFNISTLKRFSMFGSENVTGKLSNLCPTNSNLEEITLSTNGDYAEFPESISNCSKLRVLGLPRCSFSGVIPNTLRELRSLEVLNLNGNNFTAESSFFTSLTNCEHLSSLDLSDNPFLATTPPNIVTNWSNSLEIFFARNCSLYGILPPGFGNLTKLIFLELENNQLVGSIPSTFEKLKSLQQLSLSNNSLSGILPDALCSLNRVWRMFLSRNQISGGIPACIGNQTTLQYFHISSNKLEYTIPISFGNISYLHDLDLSMNLLSGSLPYEFASLRFTSLDLSANRFSGYIPNRFPMEFLRDISLADNEFEGQIPNSFGYASSLKRLNLSHNRLSGIIPSRLQWITSLVSFDVSFNNLSGSIPTDGSFRDFPYISFENNKFLCGPSRFRVPSCEDASHLSIKFIIVVVFASSSILWISFALFLVYNCCSRYRNKDVVVQEEASLPSDIVHIRISYYDILRATKNFNNDCLLGVGACGSVYKGILVDGKVVAIKIFNLRVEVASRSFDVECQVFRNLRHRNLCKVISVCSNDDFKALVMEYMPNGNLETWLHNDHHFLSILQRFSIMVDIASALEYLHQGYIIPIVHCDMKPSNILLDEDMVAYLSDFGISKLLGGIDSFVHTSTFATLGYIAPEYGSGGLVSTKCDVYSFGILLMEVFTGKRPIGDDFLGESTLRDLVKNSMFSGIMQIMDPRLMSLDDVDYTLKLNCLLSVMHLALKCSMAKPKERIVMKQVVVKLKNIMSKLLNNQSS